MIFKLAPKRYAGLKLSINKSALSFVFLLICFPNVETFCRDNDFIHDSLPASRPVYSSISMELGKNHVYDTYLSPLPYEGLHYGLRGNWQKAFTHNPAIWSMEFDTGISGGMPHNPANNSIMANLMIDFSYGINIRHQLPVGINISGGASYGFETGLLYLNRNSNNPVSAKAWTGISLNGAIRYAFKIRRLPILLSNSFKIPTLGGFFSPGYGESYYEIYLGNHSGLIHTGWWGNHAGFSNTLSANFDLGSTGISIGYSYKIRTSKHQHLLYNSTSHTIGIGVIPGGLRMRDSNKKQHITSPFE